LGARTVQGINEAGDNGHVDVYVVLAGVVIAIAVGR
jgi:hypothetical protein